MTALARSAVIVGGGIAGLTAAVALLREQWQVTVLEQAPQFREVGAGLALTANGLSVLDELGVGGQARAGGFRAHMDGTMDDRGRWLMHIPRGDSPATEMFGIYRPELHGLLLRASAGARLETGMRVTEVVPGEADGAPATVRAVTGQGVHEYAADLVVGADGLRSAVRSQLMPRTKLKYSGMSSWRGMVADTTLVSDSFTIRWGPGAEFGAVRVNADRVYWYGYSESPESAIWADEKATALERFSDWAQPVSALIEGTSDEKLLRHDVYSVAPPLKSYVSGRVVLIGDAAHAMVPTMGQGANSSLEDGLCVGLLIGRAVDAGTPLAVALAAFNAARRPRTQSIARRSEMVGRLGAKLRGKLAVMARNLAMRATPGGPAAAAGSGLLAWKPPVR
jgi:2-polyprenyl-6-methoxyphenol hydroxylase-like FAD-dependent oxidoreductase